MFKRNVFKILAVVFFLLSGAAFFYPSKTVIKNEENKKQIVTKIISPTINPNNILGRKDLTPTNQLDPIPSDYIQFYPSSIPIQPITDSTDVPVSTPIPQPTSQPPTSVPQGIIVSLSINGSSVGSFEIPQGSNQCDVLTQALSQGKIQSLNMRFSSDFGTNAVYQINGIGKENAVWWGFKVNGQSPSQGCSYIKVNNEDSVLWEYVGY